MRRAPRRDESGSALVEFVWLGVILLIPVVWILLAVFEVQRGAFAVTAAARAAGRAYVLAPDDARGAERARAAARHVLDDQGADDMPLELRVRCTTGPGRCHEGTAVVTVTVTSGVQIAFLPEILRSGPTDFELVAEHRVPVGTFVEGAR